MRGKDSVMDYEFSTSWFDTTKLFTYVVTLVTRRKSNKSKSLKL